MINDNLELDVDPFAKIYKRDTANDRIYEAGPQLNDFKIATGVQYWSCHVQA